MRFARRFFARRETGAGQRAVNRHRLRKAVMRRQFCSASAMLMRIMGTQPAFAPDEQQAFARPAIFSIGMHFLRQAATAAVAAALLSQALAADPAARQFEARAGLPEAGVKAMAGQEIEVDVDLAASSGFTAEIIGERAEARYRMAFNQVAEGWSWRPLADPRSTTITATSSCRCSRCWSRKASIPTKTRSA